MRTAGRRARRRSAQIAILRFIETGQRLGGAVVPRRVRIEGLSTLSVRAVRPCAVRADGAAPCPAFGATLSFRAGLRTIRGEHGRPVLVWHRTIQRGLASPRTSRKSPISEDA